MRRRDLLAGAGALSLATPLAATARARTPKDTAARLTQETMEALVAGPMASVEAGDLAKAQTEFETLLAGRKGNPVEYSDSLTAFGVELIIFSGGEDVYVRTVKLASAPYLARAPGAYVTAFGPINAEVALAWSTYADGLMILEPANPAGEADAALDEAWRIRMACMPRKTETASTLAMRGRLHGAVGRTQDREEAILEADRQFDRCLEMLRHVSDPHPRYPGEAFDQQARMLVANRRPALAIAAFERARPMFKAINPWGLINALEEAGYTQEARDLRAGYG